MRQIILFVSCILFFKLSFSQTENKDYYLQKSKHKKNTAWLLLGTGTVAIIIGAIIDGARDVRVDGQSYAGGFLEIAGTICVITSIPFFISSGKNKKTASALTFSEQKLIVPLAKTLAFKIQPAVLFQNRIM